MSSIKEQGANLRPVTTELGGRLYCDSPKPAPVYFFIMMRFNYKIALFCMCAGVLIITFSLWTRCGELALTSSAVARRWEKKTSNLGVNLYGAGASHSDRSSDVAGQEEIDCHINNEYTIGCRKEGDEVYLPFSFIHKYFEVYGKLSTYDGFERFEWSHSYSKVNYPKGKYDPRGIFMYFENYNVEVRERVKCISAAEGVPISTQWESQGYYYPTQIAQFGLSHYSKNLTEPEPRRKIIENGDNILATWLVPRGATFVRSVEVSHFNNKVIKFKTTENLSSAIVMKMDHVLDFVVSIDVLLKANSSVTFVLQNREKKDNYSLHYVPSDLLISTQDENIYHGIGAPGVWSYLTRDLIVDLQKGLALQSQEKIKKRLSRSKLKLQHSRTLISQLQVAHKLTNLDVAEESIDRTWRSIEEIQPNIKSNRSILQSHYFGDGALDLFRLDLVVSIILHGQGSIDNITLASSAHISQFYAAARWFVKHQDSATGGWPNPVKRRVAPGFAELQNGWYSAMGQGHAISVLARAYYHSGGDQKYLRAAMAGLRPFRVPSWDGGVLASFLGKYAWYEEYPTRPASFVLNGFIYSLLGLYDLKTIAPGGQTKEASALFEQGMISLKSLLLLYDMGSGTSYDLRHFTLKTAPNLARWDYHATHVNQLLLLSTIDSDPILSTTAARWIGYMNGKRSSHN